MYTSMLQQATNRAVYTLTPLITQLFNLPPNTKPGQVPPGWAGTYVNGKKLYRVGVTHYLNGTPVFVAQCISNYAWAGHSSYNPTGNTLGAVCAAIQYRPLLMGYVPPALKLYCTPIKAQQAGAKLQPHTRGKLHQVGWLRYTPVLY